jgi:hypothetical protein
MNKKYLITLIAYVLISAFALYIVAGTVPKMDVKNANLTELENKVRADEKQE